MHRRWVANDSSEREMCRSNSSVNHCRLTTARNLIDVFENHLNHSATGVDMSPTAMAEPAMERATAAENLGQQNRGLLDIYIEVVEEAEAGAQETEGNCLGVRNTVLAAGK
jgi:hypothetical protein